MGACACVCVRLSTVRTKRSTASPVGECVSIITNNQNLYTYIYKGKVKCKLEEVKKVQRGVKF